MKKKISLSIKQFVILAIALISVTLILVYSVFAVNNYIKGSTGTVSAFVGAGGNIAGGIIGGIVAYIVAHIQIFSSLENDKNKSYLRVASLLKLMKAEFSYNKKLLTEFTNDLVECKHIEILEQITTQAWQNSSAEVSEKLTSDDLEVLIKTVTATNMLKLHFISREQSTTMDIKSEIIVLCEMLKEADQMLDNNINQLTSRRM